MRTTWWNRVIGPVGLLVFLAVPGAGRAQAQYGYAGSYGAFAGYGAGMGMYPADQALLKEQIYALNVSQLQLNSAQAQREYWSAVLVREQALRVAPSNGGLGDGPRDPVAERNQPGVGAPRRRRVVGPARVVRRTPPAIVGVPAVAQRDVLNTSSP
jgi:hypothetical protein